MKNLRVKDGRVAHMLVRCLSAEPCLSLRKIFVMAGLVCLCVGIPAHAELAWETTKLSLETQPGAAEAKAVFRFTNVGDKPVRLKAVHASCGCTAAKPAVDLIQPGAKAELPAIINLIGVTQAKTVSIHVETDEPNRKPYTLTLAVSVAEWLKVRPRLLVWKTGETANAKAMAITLHSGASLADVQVNGGGFTTKVEPHAENAQEATLWITPTGTDSKAMATLTISANTGSALATQSKAFLRVVE